MKVVEFARAKVNLALHVLARRPDGFHELDSIVAFADVGDELTFEPAPAFELEVSGPFARNLCVAEDNLVMRAATALFQRWPLLVRPARITLNKVLPVASGIGGGSADAAAALRGLLRLSGATIDRHELAELALQLGADVPACLNQRACRMQGIGERLASLEDFAPLPVLLVNPGIEISTASVFGKLGLAPGQTHSSPMPQVIAPSGWRNDLEHPARELAPSIANVLDVLRQTAGTRHVSMSGSGATCFAVFETRAAAKAAAAAMPADWWSASAELS